MSDCCGSDGKCHYVELSRRQKAFRAGYMKAVKDEAAIYRRRHPKYRRKIH